MISLTQSKLIQKIPSRKISIEIGLNEFNEKSCLKCYNNLTFEEFQVRKREIKCLKALMGHPRVVKILDYEESRDFTNDEGSFELKILMEYLGDTDLGKYIKDVESKIRARFDDAWLRHEMTELILLFSHMQEKSICHRDIRPENIMLTENILKIIDFSEGKLAKKNNRQTFRGHLKYLSPEMRKKYSVPELEIDEYKSDIWSLGLVFLEIECLSCHFPNFDENLQDSVDEKVLQVRDNWIRNVLKNMLQVEAKNRKDFCQLREMIEQWRTDSVTCSDCEETSIEHLNLCLNCRHHICGDLKLNSITSEIVKKYLESYKQSCFDYCYNCYNHLVRNLGI